jgi:hypothetical protein
MVFAGRAVREQPSSLVDDRHPLGSEPVDRRGNEVTDRPYLLGFQHAANLEHDGSGRLHLFTGEQWSLRQHQMHPRHLDLRQGADGAGELAFERAQMVDVLNEAGGAERIGFVEDLVPDPAAARQAGLGELHAHAQDQVLRYQHNRAVVLELIGDGLAFQVLHDGGGILHRQVGEQRRHVGCGDPQHQKGEEPHQRDRDRGHRGEPRRPERLDQRGEPLHRISPRTPNRAN